MPDRINLKDASAKLAELCDRVVDDRNVVIITRSEGESVALIAADELDSLMETVYLLRSPKNAARLLSALEDAKTRIRKPQSLKELRQELGIGAAE